MWPSQPKPTGLLLALLALLLNVRLTTASSLSALTLPALNNTPSDANLTANMNALNRVTCLPHPDLAPFTDFSDCIPSLFRLYSTPLIHTVIIWDPGDFRQWGPETDEGGCYILVDGGLRGDVFAVEDLLGPAIRVLSKCFLGSVEGRNVLGKVRVGLGKDWWLSVVLQATGVGVNGTVS